MLYYDITDKSDIRKYIINGITPGKTLYFKIADTPVSVTLSHDSELDEVYIRKCHGLKTLHYSFESLVKDMESLFDLFNYHE